MDFVEGGNAVIPFEERGGVADAVDGAIVEFPDGIDHRVIVSVQDIFAIFGMAGDVNLRDAMRGDAVDVDGGIETVILRRDVDIIDVEQDAAIGALDDFVEEFPLGHFGDVKFGVAADVFDDNGNFQEIAGFADFLRR